MNNADFFAWLCLEELSVVELETVRDPGKTLSLLVARAVREECITLLLSDV